MAEDNTDFLLHCNSQANDIAIRSKESYLTEIEDHAQYVPTIDIPRMWYLWKAFKQPNHPYTLASLLENEFNIGDTIVFKSVFKGEPNTKEYEVPTEEVLQLTRWNKKV